MNITTQKEKIMSAIALAERLTGKKESLPVLSCVLLDAQGGLVVRATNLEAGIEVTVPGEIKEKGIIAVPASILSQTLRSLSGDTVSLSNEEGNLLLSARGSKTLIKAVPHEEFPALGADKKTKGIVAPRQALLKALQSVAYAASSSMIRPELGSVLISLKQNGIVCAATDSFRLAEKTVPGSFSKEVDVLLPLKHVTELVHVLEKVNSESVELVIEDSQLTLAAEGVRFVSRIVDGNFPNYKDIIPKDKTAEATLLKSDLAEMLRKARVFAGTDQQVGLHVYPKRKTFSATAQSPAVGEMSDSIDAALGGDDLDMNFHIGYLSDCLSSIETDSIALTFAGIGRPLVMRGVGDASFLYLVMPMTR